MIVEPNTCNSGAICLMIWTTCLPSVLVGGSFQALDSNGSEVPQGQNHETIDLAPTSGSRMGFSSLAGSGP